MGKLEKLIAKLEQNPRNWKIEDLKNIADRFGLLVREGKGSHVVFSYPEIPTALCIPAKRPIKPIYVRKFADLIREVRESDE